MLTNPDYRPGHAKLGVTNRPHATLKNLDPTLFSNLSHLIQKTVVHKIMTKQVKGAISGLG